MNTSINFRYIILILAGILGLCGGCSDDLSNKSPQHTESGLTLCVPAANFLSSRAGGDEVQNELTYTSLVFFAFPILEGGEPDNGKTPVITSLSTSPNNLDFVSSGYRKYAIQLPKGRYNFYLAANIYDAESTPKTEEALKKSIYNLPNDFVCQIPQKGLPMSAAPGDFFVKNGEGETSIPSTGYEYNGNGGEIYANLTFLYAKITVEAKDAADDPAQLTNIKFSNISEKEPVFFDADYSAYGTKNEIVLSSDESNNPNASDSSEALDGGDTPSASAGSNMEESTTIPGSLTFYIPERYVESSSPTSQSNLSFIIGDKELTLPLGERVGTTEATADSEENINTLPTADQLRAVKRGTHYKYILKTADRITLQVEPWTPEVISAELTGPVFLHVEKQEYPVTAGEETAVWFDSDAENVYVESPKYNLDGKAIDLYTWRIDTSTPDSIRVSVNPALPTSEYENIKNSIQNKEGEYDYFHIVAGNIHKRIAVNPLELHYYLKVDPIDITIDVALRLASGEYEGNIPVSIRTNYPRVKVSLQEGWDSLSKSEFNGTTPSQHPVKIQQMKYNADNQQEFSNQLTMSSPSVTLETYKKTESYETLYYDVYFSRLNSGLETWKDYHTMTFKIEALLDEIEDGQITETIPELPSETVTIHIVPMILNYTIHFKAANQAWTNPHIYVYQCLEFPADYTAEAPGGGTLSSQPVGYDVKGSHYAALEYSFTGALAFRGWDYPANYELLYRPDGTLKEIKDEVRYVEGFYMFNNSNINNSWNSNNVDDPFTKQRYNFNMDFCQEYRKEILCPDCKDPAKINRLWPGIRMKDEGDGWYEFELTGIATPGKALIMFADGHSGANVYRFPGADAVGVPLFDYPSKEGWLYFNGTVSDRVSNQFVSTKPNMPILPQGYREYRMYWPVAWNREKIHLWLKKEDNDMPITPNWGSAASNYQGIYETASGEKYYYFDFMTTSKNERLGVIFYNPLPQTDDLFTPLSSFIENAIGWRCAYCVLENGKYTFKSGEPD